MAAGRHRAEHRALLETAIARRRTGSPHRTGTRTSPGTFGGEADGERCPDWGVPFRRNRFVAARRADGETQRSAFKDVLGGVLRRWRRRVGVRRDGRTA